MAKLVISDSQIRFLPKLAKTAITMANIKVLSPSKVMAKKVDLQDERAEILEKKYQFLLNLKALIQPQL